MLITRRTAATEIRAEQVERREPRGDICVAGTGQGGTGEASIRGHQLPGIQPVADGSMRASTASNTEM